MFSKLSDIEAFRDKNTLSNSGGDDGGVLRRSHELRAGARSTFRSMKNGETSVSYVADGEHVGSVKGVSPFG